LVAILGPSGAGKTTLLSVLAGYRRATSGEVLLGGADLYRDAERLRGCIGFVPQRDIVHQHLTVEEALRYSAALRLPPQSTSAALAQRVHAILAELRLGSQRRQLIASLSGGEGKRVSIGVELISDPEVIFLDEPTAGLDPGVEWELMEILRALADRGRTVIVATHATRTVALANRVLFLTSDGHLAWDGPPDQAVPYFASMASAGGTPPGFAFEDIYRILAGARDGGGAEWSRRFEESQTVEGYALPMATASRPDAPRAGAQTDLPVAPRTPYRPSSVRQCRILLARNLSLLRRDRFALALILLAAPLLAMLDFAIVRRGMFNVIQGDTARIVTNTNTLIVNAMLVGALTQMREIIKEADIYRRERVVVLRTGPYLCSKVALAGVLALYQAVWWVGIRYLAVSMPGGVDRFVGMYLTIVLATMAGMLLGLFASSIASSDQAVPLLVALLIIPQVLFSGAHLPVYTLNPVVRGATALMPSRWAFEALVSEYGYGKAVAKDSCWQLTAPMSAALTVSQQEGCTCQGPNILTRCAFPGIRAHAQPGSQDAVGDRPPAAEEVEARAVASAEGRLAADVANYGRLYDVSLPQRWSAQLMIVAILTLLIYGVLRIKAWPRPW
jgi:ABC-type multidrug transport system ATPase subunit